MTYNEIIQTINENIPDNTEQLITAEKVRDTMVGMVDYSEDKADKVTDAVNGNLAGLDADGNITDSNIAPSSLATQADISNFITNTVNNLTNYYLKTETYTQTEVNNLIGAIQQFHYEIYQALPASGASNVLYLIGPAGSGSDRYEEYVYANNTFTKIGDTSIDLSGYVTIEELNIALASYALKTGVVILTGSTVSQELADNTVYQCSTVGSLEISLPNTVTPDYISQINFISGVTATALVAPNTIIWYGDDVVNSIFTPVANTQYVVMLYFDGANFRAIVQA